MHRPILGACSLLVAILFACEGDVSDGGGGGGTPTASTETGTQACVTTITTSSLTAWPTGTGCNDSRWYLDRSFGNAVECQPQCDQPHCTGATVVFDACGCPVVANDLIPELADEAVEDYERMVRSCDPAPCTSPCPPGPDEPWYCDPDSGRCTPE